MLRRNLREQKRFLREAPVCLPGGATSALDSESEAGVHEELNELARGRSVVAGAHRLSKMRDSDRIVAMEAGPIVDAGTPEALARRDGPYTAILVKQAA